MEIEKKVATVKIAMIRARTTQAEIARQLGVKQQVVYDVLNERRKKSKTAIYVQEGLNRLLGLDPSIWAN